MGRGWQRGGSGGGKGSGGGRSYDWKQHTHASDDPQVQNDVRQVCERVLAGEPGYSETVEAWGHERQTYKRYCWQYGLSFEKVDRGYFRIEKLDPDAGNPFQDLLKLLERLGGGAPMETRDLLWHAKTEEVELWRRLGVKGVTNCSERKLQFLEDEVKQFFSVSQDWRTIAPLGGFGAEKEAAKPIRLTAQSHASMVRKAIQSMEDALRAVPWRGNENQKGGKDLFCAFNEDSSPVRGQTLLAQRTSPAFIRMLPGRERLPAYQRKDVVLEKLEACDVLVICGATGCGKTTQLPQILVEAMAERGDQSRVICTQPRRISATSVAERVAQERGDRLGQTVGYQIRFEHKASALTSLLYCTVGILLRHLASNPNLDGVGVVVVDEVHERDVHTDFVLLILRDLVMGPRRGTLKLVLMSATINAQGFVNYFAKAGASLASATQLANRWGRTQRGDEAPQAKAMKASLLSVEYFEIPGKTNYPIEEYFLEDILEVICPDFTPAGPPPPKKWAAPGLERNLWALQLGEVSSRLENRYSESTCSRLTNALRRPLDKTDWKLVSNIVLHIASFQGPGAVLIFVPGWAEITDCIKDLEAARHKCEETWHIFPLHSMVPPNEQYRIFQVFPEDSGERKIIVSTNIAETSITVEDVVFVIDSGLIKGTTYTPKTNVAALKALRISRSNAQQRRGRAGRVRPGKFFKLYSKIDWDEMADSMEPEMQRTPVEELCLQVRALELPGRIGDVLGRAIDPPERLAVSNALFLLRSLGALDEHEQLTPLGWKLALLPIHPSLGKMMLLGSLFDCVPELLSVCATLSSKSPFVLPFGKEKEADAAKSRLGEGLPGDHLLYARALAAWLRRSPRERNSFCFDYFLSDKVLQQIDKTRRDLHTYVMDLKLRPAGETLQPGDDSLGPDRCSELLCVLASSLQLATRPPSQTKFKCLEITHASCAVHPSSLCDKLVEAKKKGGRKWDQEAKYGVLCWFSRLKTAELYLHDVSFLADTLPLVLLSPHVTRRETDPTVFEVVPPEGADDVDDDDDEEITESVDGPDSVGATSAAEARAPPPPLLLKLGDAALASQLWDLRGRLTELVDRIIGQPPAKLPEQVAVAFHALRALIHASYKLHQLDFEACEEFGGEDAREEVEVVRSPAAMAGRGAGKRGGGKGGGGGYPWWEHIKGRKGKGRWQ